MSVKYPTPFLFRLELPITVESATPAIRRHLDNLYQGHQDVEIVAAEWMGDLLIFFYQSKKYLRTHHFLDQLFGNGPIMIDSVNGDVIKFGTVLPLEDYLQAYRETRSEK